MTLRSRILVYLVGIHLGFAAVAIVVLIERPAWLFAVEGLFLLSLIAAFRLTRSFFVPLELIRTGAELIQERDFSSRFRPVGQPEMDALIAVYNRMLDQLRGERLRVREQNELFDQIVAASPGGVVILDLDGRVSQLNPAAADLLGAGSDELRGQSLDATGTALGDALATLDAGASRVLSLADGRRVRCQRAEFRDRGFARSFLLIEELTEELRQSEKAAYGKLIRLMSHEVNNSVAALGSLLGSVGSLAGQLRDDDRRDFEQALEVAGARLDHLRSFMNGFAEVVRLPAPDRRPCDLAALLEDLHILMAAFFAERRIRFDLDIADRPPPVSLDKNQIEQVLLNLLKNAAEAVALDPGGRGGTVAHNSLRDAEGSDPGMDARSAFGPGQEGLGRESEPQVRILGAVILRLGSDRPDGGPRRPWVEVEDDGRGIPAADRGQLFTPFFTTKDNGCGLGLTVVKEILTRHGFGISLLSPERPTRFRVELG